MNNFAESLSQDQFYRLLKLEKNRHSTYFYAAELSRTRLQPAIDWANKMMPPRLHDHVYGDVCLPSTPLRARDRFIALSPLLIPGSQLVCLSLSAFGSNPFEVHREVDNLIKRAVRPRLVSLEFASLFGKAGWIAMRALMDLSNQYQQVPGLRSKVALSEAHERGKRVGRPPRLNETQVVEALRWKDAGMTLTDIASQMGVDATTVSRHIKRFAEQVESVQHQVRHGAR